MKPAEELVREITSNYVITGRYGKDGISQCRINEEIAEAIHQDRLAVRKKCAEVARNYMCDCEQNDNGEDCSDFIAKAIEEMELK